MKKIFNSRKENEKFHNARRWGLVLFSLPFGKGSGLQIRAEGWVDNDKVNIAFHTTKKEDYKTIPERRKSCMESSYLTTLRHNTGICWICGEIHPRVIETHHLYESRGKNKHGNTLRGDFVSGICANCHRKRKATGGKTDNHQIAILKAIEKEWFGLGGK